MKAASLVLVLFILGLQLRLWLGDGSIHEVMQLETEVTKQTELVDGLKKRNEVLEAEVLDLKNRLSALEERARTDLGMIKKGESFLQVR